MTGLDEIRRLIKKELSAGKRQVALANEIGVSHSTIYKLLYTNTRPTAETLLKIANYFKVPLAFFVGGESREARSEIEGEGLIKVPVLRELRGGQLQDFVREQATEYIWIRDVIEETVSMVAKDNSMAPVIKKGDYVLFREDQTIKDGDVAVAVDQWHNLIVRRFRKRDAELFLVPDNPEYHPIKVTAKYRILGKASEVISRKRL